MMLRQTIRKVLRENINDPEYAVIEITKPSSRMPQKWYFQAVPLNRTEADKIYIKRGPSGILTISTKNIKILKTFKKSEKEEMDKYLEKVRDEDKKKGEQNETELTEKCWKGYTQKGMKTMFGKRYPNCVKKNKVLKEEIGSVDEEALSKMITKLILGKGKYPWVKKVHSVELSEENSSFPFQDVGTGARILLEINTEYFTPLNKQWGNYTSREDVFIYYGMEIARHFINKEYSNQPFFLANDIIKLADSLGLNPHPSLFNVYFVTIPTEEEKTIGKKYG